MITRIELNNFMSHAHSVIEPAAGLTVLIGANNVGKSAVVAALQILCTNENSTYVMRHGAKECSVIVTTDDGHTIEWRRKNSPSYVVDDQKFDRLKQSGLPEELHKALRLPGVEAGMDTEFDVHFGTQKAPIFLLNGSSANAARFFASSSDAIRLVTMQRKHKEKLAHAQRDKNQFEAQSRELNAELALLEPVVELDDRLEKMEHVHAELVEQTSWLAAATAHAAALGLQTVEVARYAGQSAVLAPLAAPPVLAATDPLAALIEACQTAKNAQAAATAQEAALAPLIAPPALADCERIERLSQGIVLVSVNVTRWEAELVSVSALAPPPTLEATAPWERMIVRFGEVSREGSEAAAWGKALQTLTPPPRLADEARLDAMVQSLAATSAGGARWQRLFASLSEIAAPPPPSDGGGLLNTIDQIERAQTELAVHVDAFASADAETAETASLLRAAAADAMCAACGGPLDPERVVARAAAGLGGHDHG